MAGKVVDREADNREGSRSGLLFKILMTYLTKEKWLNVENF